MPYPPGSEETKVSNADLNVWFPATDVQMVLVQMQGGVVVLGIALH
jgi:hypothetical protein